MDRTNVNLSITQDRRLTRGPLDRLVERSDPDDAEARLEVVVTVERAVNDRPLAALEPQAHALGARSEAFGPEQRAGAGNLSMNPSTRPISAWSGSASDSQCALVL